MQAHNTIASGGTTTGVVKPAQPETGARSLEDQSGIGVEFLSNLAHQLRSPLSSLRVWVDLLNDPAALASPEDTKRLVEGIDRATSRLERQISDVLEVGYLETGTLTFETSPVDATQQITMAVADADYAARSRRISFDLNFGEQTAVVLSSETRLRQILAALFSNAIRFSPVGGTISVVSGRTPYIADKPKATKVLEPNFPKYTDGAHFICVSNEGPVIPPELHHEIFRPFQRAVRKDAHGGGGSGLGLAIAFGLIKLHGGGIWVHSDPTEGQDSGAQFEFSLPEVSVVPVGPAGNDLN